MKIIDDIYLEDWDDKIDYDISLSNAYRSWQLV